MGNALWGGVRLRDVLNRVGVKGDALEVVFDGADQAALPGTPDFVKSLPVDRALDEHTLIAFEMNGEPLPHWHGAPARLVVAGWTATYWVKHLTSIRVEPKAFDGFWMKSAYRIPTGAFPGARFASQENAATTPITEILINSLVTSHVDGDRLQRGRPAELAGWAWDGGSGISAVEISTDEGRSWRATTLGEAPSSYSWRGFRAALDTSKSGPAACRSSRHRPQRRHAAGETDAQPCWLSSQHHPDTDAGGRMNARWRCGPALAALFIGSLAAAAGEETVKLQDAPGRDLVVARCSVCHSVDYVQMNAPALDRAGWEKSVRKMIDQFGAPISEADAKSILDYLAANY